jgi:hypothetical protein
VLLKLYKVMAIPSLLYGREKWALRADEITAAAAEM